MSTAGRSLTTSSWGAAREAASSHGLAAHVRSPRSYAGGGGCQKETPCGYYSIYSREAASSHVPAARDLFRRLYAGGGGDVALQLVHPSCEDARCVMEWR